MRFRYTHNTLLLTIISTGANMDYTKALRDLETKLTRQKQAVAATEAMITAIKTLAEQETKTSTKKA